MDYKLDKLEGGLRVITVPMPSLESATVTVWVGVGSRFEDKNTLGISHFLEHMVFKGSKKRPSAKEVSEAIDSFGGEFNASTSKEWTNFYIKTPVNRLETAIDVLSDMVLNPILKDSDIEREKGVIVEEMAMYEDTPMAKVGDYFENLIFSGNNLSEDVIGKKETVISTKKSDFVAFRENHYKAGNVVITVSGGIDRENTLDLIRKYFVGFKKGKRDSFDNFSFKQDKPRINLVKKDINQAHMIIGFVGNRMGHEDRFKEAVLESVLGGGMSSRMFTEVREKRGLAYAVRTSTDHYLDTGSFSVYAGIDLKRVDDAVSVILEQFYNLSTKKEKISEKELKKAKEYLKGHLALSLENTKAVNLFFGLKELLLGKVETIEEIFKQIDNVKVNDVYELSNKIFKKESLNMAIIGPFKDKNRFEKIINKS